MEQKLKLKPNQTRALEQIKEFICNDSVKVFILKGYAGTGKTTMMKVLIEELTKRNLPYSLMASTGRAAKILANATSGKTTTIHGRIYSYKDLNQDLESVVRSRADSEVDKTGQLMLTFERVSINNADYDCHYYIIDEASMVSDKEDKTATQAIFGTGKLLEDLLYYDTKGKFVFVGDVCQLPPILQDFSPALHQEYIQSTYHIGVDEVELTGLIRPALGYHSPLLEVGDLLLVTQNNYVSGLMNGDMVKLTQIGVKEQLAGLTFVKVEVVELFTKKSYSQLLIEEVVYGIATNLSQVQQKELFIDFYLRMKQRHIKQKSEAFRMMMMIDPYLNALRAVYGYALTCHKAQGGEWNDVFLDIPRNLPFNPKQETYQWIYTAMTRAKVQLHIVNDFWVC